MSVASEGKGHTFNSCRVRHFFLIDGSRSGCLIWYRQLRSHQRNGKLHVAKLKCRREIR